MTSCGLTYRAFLVSSTESLRKIRQPSAEEFLVATVWALNVRISKAQSTVRVGEKIDKGNRRWMIGIPRRR